MNKDVLKQFREKLAKKLPENSAVLLFSGKRIGNKSGNDYEFEVGRNFYYLTGVEQEDSMFMLMNIQGIIREKLFILKDEPEKTKWIGKKLSADEVKKISGIDDIDFTEDYEKFIYNLVSTGLIDTLYMETDMLGIEDLETLENKKYEDYRKRFPFLKLKDAAPMINEMREIKVQEELSKMAIAAKITKLSLEQAMRIIKPGVHEAEVSSLIEYIARKNRAKTAFPTIVAGGKNACVLHYDKAAEKLEDGDMVLIDCGSAVGNYCCDVSRTYPVSGKFTPRQKELYDIVLNANKTVISKVKPGVTLKELNDTVIEIYAREFNLIKEREDIEKYYYHFVSHYVGLQCHDPFDRNKPLKEGMVITVEPGLYIEEENTGIRIEDDVLVTETGCSVITGNIIKEVNDIEEFMDSWELK